MHTWGDETFAWDDLELAIRYIETNLKRWGRVSVSQAKEKFGCARIYCSLGWSDLHSITHPGYCFSQYPQWLWNFNCLYSTRLMILFNWFIVPYHMWLYRKLYSDMVKKFPHIKTEITCDADFPELLKNI